MILVTSVGEVPARVDGATVTLRLPPPENRGSIDLRGPDGTVTGRLIVAGVPHFVLHVEEITAWPLAAVAPTLRRDPALGREGANVDVVARDRAGRVHVRTFERGVEGETLACGTGAVAAAYDARIDGASGRIDVVPASGVPLTVELPGDPLRPEAAILTGDARFIFEGVLAPDGLAGTS